MTEINWSDVEAQWAGAPEDVREVARQIAQGIAPEPQVLFELGPKKLSDAYPVPADIRTNNGHEFQWHTTLLAQALTSGELESTHALLNAGADPNAFHANVVFLAIEKKTRDTPNFMLFPDHDESLPFLRAYLEAGVDTSTLRYGFRAEAPLDYARIVQNLGAMLILLEFGADPWVQHENPSGIKSDGMLVDLAFSSLNNATAEILFRLGRSGFLQRGPQDREEALLETLGKVVAKIEGGSGPDARHHAWRMDQVLQVLGKALARESETNALRARLPKFDYEEDGGWYLAETETHSRHDAPPSVPDKGSEVWGP